MSQQTEVFKSKILSEIKEYEEFVKRDNKITYNEKIQKLGAIEFIKQTIEFTPINEE